jgi:hypothetical protein
MEIVLVCRKQLGGDSSVDAHSSPAAEESEPSCACRDASVRANKSSIHKSISFITMPNRLVVPDYAIVNKSDGEAHIRGVNRVVLVKTPRTSP